MSETCKKRRRARLALMLAALAFSATASLPALEPDRDAAEPVLVRIVSDSQNEGYEACRALDGDPETFWHSQFSSAPFEPQPIPIRCGYDSGCTEEHPKRVPSRKYSADRPFELRIDLGAVYPLSGVRYASRLDGEENGKVGDYELYAFESLPEDDAAFASDGDWFGDPGKPVAVGTFTAEDQKGALVKFAEPVNARYIVFRAKSELRGNEFAAVSELAPLSEGRRFLSRLPKRDSARKLSYNDAMRILTSALPDAAKSVPDDVYFRDVVDQYNRLIDELARPEYYAAIQNQVADRQSLILPEDRDPADVMVRRTVALACRTFEIDDPDASAEGMKFLKLFGAKEGLLKRAKDVPVQNEEERFALFAYAAGLKRAVIFQRPELDFDRILFVKRNRSNYSHLCDQFYGRSAMPGGGLFVLEKPFGDPSAQLAALKNGYDAGLAVSFVRPNAFDLLKDSRVEGDSTLAGKALEGGAFISPELSFDGEKIAFAWCACTGSTDHVESLDLSRGHTQEGRCYHIFTCDADGSNLRQITDGTWNDFDPCFLPKGRMAFISERRGGYLRCGRDCPNYTLFDMNQDGSKKRVLSVHETNEWAPSVSNDGQILWTRWDYIDRFGCIAHGAWTTTPDGRNPRAVCGNYAPRHLRPDSVLDIRSIPESGKLIATAGPHHGQSFGSIVELDPNAPDDPFSPVIRMTPDVGFPESQNGAQVWGTPWALAEDLFLAVADYGMDQNKGREGGRYVPGNYGIYLVDAMGNRELIYRDPEIGASTPIPFVARETPPVVPGANDIADLPDLEYFAPPAFDAPRPQGVVAVQNVYATDEPYKHDKKIAAIRVVQLYCMSVPSGRPPYEIGVRERTATDSVKIARRVWGVAPVEEDGSAYFSVPADCELMFQTLDEDGLVVQSMRSGTALRPGERLGCVGCHESRETAASAFPAPGESGAAVPIAFRREPSKLLSEGEGTEPVNFPQLVQPILERHCTECHAKPESVAKGAPGLSRKSEHGYYESYWNLADGGFAFNNFHDPLRSLPEYAGARSSKLLPLLEDHYDVKLSDAERRRIALWLDTTANFYGVYDKEGCEKEFRGEFAAPTLE